MDAAARSLAIPPVHPALDRALAIAGGVAPDEARDAAAVLATLLRGFDASAVEDPWHQSRLSCEGYPVELSFSSRDAGLRYTSEVAEPGVAPAARTARAVALFEQLTGGRLPRPLVDRLVTAQAAGELRYGAWLGGRHHGARRSFKLYLEVPAEADPILEPWDERLVCHPRVLRAREPLLSMVGLQVRPLRVELYYHVKRLMVGEVATLMSRVHLNDLAPAVLDRLRRLYRRPLERELPCTDFGFSYAISPDGAPPCFTLYTFATSLLGGDAKIRSAILGAAAAVDRWDVRIYERLSKTIASRRGRLTRHGLVGVAVAPGEAPAIVFGLAPPEEEAP